MTFTNSTLLKTILMDSQCSAPLWMYYLRDLTEKTYSYMWLISKLEVKLDSLQAQGRRRTLHTHHKISCHAKIIFLRDVSVSRYWDFTFERNWLFTLKRQVHFFHVTFITQLRSLSINSVNHFPMQLLTLCLTCMAAPIFQLSLNLTQIIHNRSTSKATKARLFQHCDIDGKIGQIFVPVI